MNIAIIGGGASGMMAAIQAAKKHATVTIFEKNDRVGKKILMTGNGKCNLSNTNFDLRFFHSDTKTDLSTFFDAFGVKETISFFEKEGMLIKNKNGYLYPASEQASTVLDVLRFALKRLGVICKTDAEVKKIYKKGNQFGVETKTETIYFDSVIIASGSKAGPQQTVSGSGYMIAKSLGHHVVEPLPALVQLRCKEDYFKQIAGIRTDCSLTMLVNGKPTQCERGELQLTEYGISGIVVFQLSGNAAKALKCKNTVQVQMDFLPDFTEETYKAFVHNRFEAKKGQTAEEFFLGMTNKKLLMLFLKLSGLSPAEIVDEQTKEKCQHVFSLLRTFTVNVKETNPFPNAQICCGGVRMDEVTNNLESKIVPGLYFCGELLDVDGRCGGYNLQWAWTSGYIAGVHAAKKESV